jgi:hypothetical protein
MSHNRFLREIAPIAAAAAAAFLIELAAQTTGWAAGWTYALAGVAATCLVLVGVPFALGYRVSVEPSSTPQPIAGVPAQHMSRSLVYVDLGRTDDFVASDHIQLRSWTGRTLTSVGDFRVDTDPQEPPNEPPYSFLLLDRQKQTAIIESEPTPSSPLIQTPTLALDYQC